MEYTKGDWEFSNNDGWCEIQIKEPLKSICAVNINVTEHIPNGNLLAAAPKLLEALKELVSQVEQYSKGEIATQDYFSDEIKVSKLAIEKAVAV